MHANSFCQSLARYKTGLLFRSAPVGFGHELLTIPVRFAPEMLSTLDPASAVPRARKRARNMPAAFESLTQGALAPCSGADTYQNSP